MVFWGDWNSCGNSEMDKCIRLATGLVMVIVTVGWDDGVVEYDATVIRGI